MVKKIALLHTATGVANLIKEPVSQHLSQYKTFNLVDEGSLQEIIRVGSLTPKVLKNVCQNVIAAQEYGADAVLLTCSSIGQCVNIARQLVDIKVYRIDEAMAENAVEIGKKIGVVATLNTTLIPTCNLIKEKAGEQGKYVIIKTALCDNAFQAFVKGDTASYERLIIAKIEELSEKTDVIVLAQASMSTLVERINIEQPVLTSVQSGILRLKENMASLRPVI